MTLRITVISREDYEVCVQLISSIFEKDRSVAASEADEDCSCLQGLIDYDHPNNLNHMLFRNRILDVVGSKGGTVVFNKQK